MGTRFRMGGLALLVAGLGVGVSGGAATAEPDDEADTVVEVSLVDYEFRGLPASVDGPAVRFEAVNRGPSDHELEVVDAGGETHADLGMVAELEVE